MVFRFDIKPSLPYDGGRNVRDWIGARSASRHSRNFYQFKTLNANALTKCKKKISYTL